MSLYPSPAPFAPRKESIIATYAGVDQEEDQFTWLQAQTGDIFNEDAVDEPGSSCRSPSSELSSGPRTPDSFAQFRFPPPSYKIRERTMFMSRDSDSDSDSGSESDPQSDVEPRADPCKYVKIGDQVFPEPISPKTRVPRTDQPYRPPTTSTRKTQPERKLSIPRRRNSRVIDPAPAVMEQHQPETTERRRPVRAARRKIAFSPLYDRGSDSDMDADAESDGDATDDEFIPSAPSSPIASAPSPSNSLKRRSPSSSPSSYGSVPSKRPRTQVPAARSRVRVTSTSPVPLHRTNPFACNYCSYIQHNRRKPDLTRHMRIHTRGTSSEVWVCAGVPLERVWDYADSLGLAERDDGASFKKLESMPKTTYGEYTMVGGCGKEFSRRDALKRHVDNVNVCCVGDLSLQPFPVQDC